MPVCASVREAETQGDGLALGERASPSRLNRYAPAPLELLELPGAEPGLGMPV